MGIKSCSLFVMWLVPLASWISTKGGEIGRKILSCIFGFETVLNLHSIGSTIQVGRTQAIVPLPAPNSQSAPFLLDSVTSYN